MIEDGIQWFFRNTIVINESWVEPLSFFIYDSIKIIFLLFIMIFLIGILRSYLPEQKIKLWLSKKKLGLGNFMASCFGAITPFCSCSSIPLFLSFVRAGVPLGITFSFLITSPLVNEYLVVLMIGFFGWKITVAYIIFGILIGVVTGLILGKMKLEKYLIKDVAQANKKCCGCSVKINKYQYGYNEAKSITKKTWLWIVAGVGLGALIHNMVPEAVVHSIIGKGGLWTVPIAVIIGVPIYANCAAIIPVALVLFEKGVPLGTALSFMMATAALSLPEAIILKRVMKTKLILIFFGIVTIGIIIIGYLFNFLQGIF